MIHPSKGDHANHPGHGNGDCPLRQQVNAHIYGTSSNGYSCYWTGGHCVKDDSCASRVEQHEAEAPMRKQQEELAELFLAQKELFRRKKGRVQ